MARWFTIAGLLISLLGAMLGAFKGTWPPGRVPVGSSWEEADSQVQRVMNWLRVGLGLIGVGTVLQIIGAIL
jgi:hypothetical protein